MKKSGAHGENGKDNGGWRLTREKVLMVAGLVVIAAELVISVGIEKSFHYEFLLAGLALCGIGIAQWGDRK